MSEYSAEVSMRKLMSTTRSILPRGAGSRNSTVFTFPAALSSAVTLSWVPR